MRASRTLLLAAGAVAAAGLLDAAASAAGFTLRRSTTTSTTSAPTSTASAPATSTASAPAISIGGTSTGTSAPAQSTATQDVDSALFALAAGGHTLAGPAAFFSSIGDDTNVYQVLTGAAVDVCVTVRNLARGQIRVSATGAPSVDVDAGETLAACYAAPLVINLACREGGACAGAWRVDRH